LEKNESFHRNDNDPHGTFFPEEYMKRIALLLVFAVSLCFAQKTTIDLAAYKTNKNFTWAETSYAIGKHTFGLVNIKPRVKGDTACISAILIDKRKYVLFDIGTEAGAYGLFVPRYLPISEGLVVLKASPTEAKTFIFLSNGKLITLPGAQVIADTVGKYIYCVWENDKQYRLTVFNVKNMILVMPTKIISQPDKWYASGVSYYFSSPQEKGYYSIDLFTKSVVKTEQPEGTLSPASYLMDFSKIEPPSCCSGKALKR
jgi:hypothetical protein